MKLLKYITIALFSLASVWMGCHQPAAPKVDMIDAALRNDSLRRAIERAEVTAYNDSMKKRGWEGRYDSVLYHKVGCDSCGYYWVLVEKSLPVQKKKPKHIHTDNQSVNINGDNNGEINQSN